MGLVLRPLIFALSALAACIIAAAAPAIAAAPTHVWSHAYGDAGSQTARALAVDPFGNIVMVGEFASIVDFGNGPLTSAGGEDVFLTRFSPDGSITASHRFGDAGTPQRAVDVAVDRSSNIFVTGYFTGSLDLGGGALAGVGSNDVYVARFDASTNHVWSQRYGDADGQYASGIAVDQASNVYVCGYFSGSIDFGGGPLLSGGFDDAFLVKLDGAGAHVWSKRFGNNTAQQATGVAVDPSGNVFVVGHFAGSIDLGGGVLVSAGNLDVFVAKFSPAGSQLWSKRFGSTQGQTPRAVATDEHGNVYIAGAFKTSIDFGGGVLTSAGSDDIFLAKLDADGNHLWSKRFGSSADAQVAQSVTVDASERVTIGGCFRGTVNFGTGMLISPGTLEDAFVAGFNASGVALFSARYGDAEAQFVDDVAAEPFGDVLLAGHFASTVDFGGGALASAGTEDAFLARLVTWTLVDVPPPVFSATALRAYPNPFNPSTTLDATIPRSGRITLSVHDATGRRVAVLFDGPHDAGAITVRWSGITDAGSPATSGVYFARLEFPGGTVTRKLVLVK